MKQILLGTALAVYTSIGSVFAQQVPFEENLALLKGNIWTDGKEFVKYISPFDASEVFDIPIALEDDKTLLLYGGGLYQGGDCIFLKTDGQTITVGDEDLHPWFPTGDIVEADGKNGILFIRDAQSRHIHGILKAVTDLSLLSDIIQKNFLRLGLAGKYTDEQGVNYEFSAKKCKAKGFPKGHDTFQFGQIRRIPQFILVFDQMTYFVSQIQDGIQLIPASHYPLQDTYRPIPDAEPLTLLRVPDDSRYEYPLLSEEYFTQTELALYGTNPFDASGHIKNERSLKIFLRSLAVMRNELLARHGFIFKEKEWADYFGRKTWYKPEKEDVSSELTEMEKANSELIQYLEKKLTRQLNQF